MKKWVKKATTTKPPPQEVPCDMTKEELDVVVAAQVKSHFAKKPPVV
jgi:hypothetical protein